MIILGINSAYHESAAALVVDGRLIAFVEEERINRRKHGKPALISNPDLLPTGAIQHCLTLAGITWKDIDRIAFSFDQRGRLGNLDRDTHAAPNSWGTPEGERVFHETLERVPDKLEDLAGRPIRDALSWVPHHLAHVASAFYCSPFEKALIMAVDGIGEVDLADVVEHGRLLQVG